MIHSKEGTAGFRGNDEIFAVGSQNSKVMLSGAFMSKVKYIFQRWTHQHIVYSTCSD